MWSVDDGEQLNLSVGAVVYQMFYTDDIIMYMNYNYVILGIMYSRLCCLIGYELGMALGQRATQCIA